MARLWKNLFKNGDKINATEIGVKAETGKDLLPDALKKLIQYKIYTTTMDIPAKTTKTSGTINASVPPGYELLFYTVLGVYTSPEKNDYYIDVTTSIIRTGPTWIRVAVTSGRTTDITNGHVEIMGIYRRKY